MITLFVGQTAGFLIVICLELCLCLSLLLYNFCTYNWSQVALTVFEHHKDQRCDDLFYSSNIVPLRLDLPKVIYNDFGPTGPPGVFGLLGFGLVSNFPWAVLTYSFHLISHLIIIQVISLLLKLSQSYAQLSLSFLFSQRRPKKSIYSPIFSKVCGLLRLYEL